MNNMWENPKCNLCGRYRYKIVLNNIKTWITDGSYRLVSCKNCELVYLSPRPKKKYILKYYPPETYWGTEIVKSKVKEDVNRRGEVYDYLYSQIIKNGRKGTILDLGAGTGIFLSKFKELGWKTLGVELSATASRYAKRAYGIKLITGSFPEIKLPAGKYDVITLNGCLEHLYKPKESLIKIFKLLNNEGIVEITVPNFDSLGRRIFGRYWYALQPPSHLYHFTPATITKMLRNAGFNEIEIRHDYWSHNFYILFESMRLSFSPKFKGDNITDFSKTATIPGNSKKTFKMEIGKILAKLISIFLAIIEPIAGKGEVMTIYAKKN